MALYNAGKRSMMKRTTQFMTKNKNMTNLASFPGLPRFMFFGYMEAEEHENGEGLGTPIT